MTLLPEIISEACDGNRASFTLRIPPELAHFPGHFPGRPLLPGVVEVDWAVRLGLRHFMLATERFSALKGLKFNSPILPGTVLQLTLTWSDGKSRLDFIYQVGARACATGQILFAQQQAGEAA